MQHSASTTGQRRTQASVAEVLYFDCVQIAMQVSRRLLVELEYSTRQAAAELNLEPIA